MEGIGGGERMDGRKHIVGVRYAIFSICINISSGWIYDNAYRV